MWYHHQLLLFFFFFEIFTVAFVMSSLIMMASLVLSSTHRRLVGVVKYCNGGNRLLYDPSLPQLTSVQVVYSDVVASLTCSVARHLVQGGSNLSKDKGYVGAQRVSGTFSSFLFFVHATCDCFGLSHQYLSQTIVCSVHLR